MLLAWGLHYIKMNIYSCELAMCGCGVTKYVNRLIIGSLTYVYGVLCTLNLL